MSNLVLDGYEDFLNLREYVMKILDKIDMSDGCKSYEGTFELLLSYPSYFDDGAELDSPDAVIINLHCYVLGPSRHHSWRDETLKGAIKKCRRDINQWITWAKQNGELLV